MIKSATKTVLIGLLVAVNQSVATAGETPPSVDAAAAAGWPSPDLLGRHLQYEILRNKPDPMMRQLAYQILYSERYNDNKDALAKISDLSLVQKLAPQNQAELEKLEGNWGKLTPAGLYLVALTHEQGWVTSPSAEKYDLFLSRAASKFHFDAENILKIKALKENPKSLRNYTQAKYACKDLAKHQHHLTQECNQTTTAWEKNLEQLAQYDDPAALFIKGQMAEAKAINPSAPYQTNNKSDAGAADRTSLDYYKKAAELGEPRAQEKLSIHHYAKYLNTQNKADLSEAKKWASLSERAGNPGGAAQLASILEFEGDFSTAHKIIKNLASDTGNQTAIERLQLMEKSKADFQKNKLSADTKNEPTNNYKVAQALANGKGANKNYPLAAMYAKRSAEQGNSEAQNLFAYFLYTGTGLPRDEAAAYFWSLLSAGAGNNQAKERVFELEHGLPPNDRLKIQNLASQWKKKRRLL